MYMAPPGGLHMQHLAFERSTIEQKSFFVKEING